MINPSRNCVIISLFILMMASFANAENIVVIGDSLSCGPFGIQMVKDLSSAGKNKVTLYCAVSSKPSDWLSGHVPKFSDGCHMLTSDGAATKFQKDLCPNPSARPRHATYITGKCDGPMPKLSSILSQHPGARVIVALGTNSLGNGKTDPSYRSFATQIRATGHSCVWVGPPHCRVDQATTRVFPKKTVMLDEKGINDFSDSLQNSVANHIGQNEEKYCGYIDSRDLTQREKVPTLDAAETMDGVHRTDCAGKIWADKVKNKIAESNVNPVELISPPESTSRPAAGDQ